jgi:hypothetical protein
LINTSSVLDAGLEYGILTIIVRVERQDFSRGNFPEKSSSGFPPSRMNRSSAELAQTVPLKKPLEMPLTPWGCNIIHSPDINSNEVGIWETATTFLQFDQFRRTGQIGQ